MDRIRNENGFAELHIPEQLAAPARHVQRVIDLHGEHAVTRLNTALRLAFAGVIACGMSAPVTAQQLDLSISPSVISIPSADPDVVPVVTSAPVSVNYRVRQNSQGSWQLTVVANGDLESGAATIDISAVSWSATPAPPFQNGMLSKSVAQIVASGSGNQASPATGSLTFSLANSWTYDVGIYTQTLVFTLSTP